MNTTKLDLSEFINAFTLREDGRMTLAKPWSKDGKTYATDGRAMIVLDASLPAYAPDPEAKLPNTAKVLDEHKFPPSWIDADLQFIELPEIEKADGFDEHWRPPACDECDGTGEIDCPCNCEYCERTDDCFCDAVHLDHAAEYEWIEVAPKIFIAARYLWIIGQLPNVKVDVSPSEYPALRFFFDGGIGVVMGRKPE